MSDLKPMLKRRLRNSKPLSSEDILNSCKSYELFNGVYMRDTLPEKKHGAGIINLDSVKGNGTHWALFLVDEECYYFDSFGFSAPKELEKYFNDDYIYSSFKLQDGGNYCGHLCILILDNLSKNMRFQDAVLELVN
jgi:hypothetical protein